MRGLDRHGSCNVFAILFASEFTHESTVSTHTMTESAPKTDPKSKRIKGPMSSHVNDVNGSTGSIYAVSLNIRLFIRILVPNMCRIHHCQRCNVTSFLEPDDRISQDQNNAHFHPLHRLHLASKSPVINLRRMVKHPVCQKVSVLSPDVIKTLQAASIKCLSPSSVTRNLQNVSKCLITVSENVSDMSCPSCVSSKNMFVQSWCFQVW